ncbi:unnamed protein product, partial [Polarella glacialis]
RSSFRVRALDAALRSDGLLSAASWASSQAASPPPQEVVLALQLAVLQELGKITLSEAGLKIFIVCGGDERQKFRNLETKEMQGIVMIPQFGEDMLLEKPNSRVFVANPCPNKVSTISSTRVWEAIRSGDLAFLSQVVPEEAARLFLAPTPQEIAEFGPELESLLPIVPECAWPAEKFMARLPELEQGKKLALLFTSGAMSPAHLGHLEMLQKAKERLDARGFHTVATWLSPWNDNSAATEASAAGYVPLGAAFRLKIAGLTACGDEMSSAASWQSTQKAERILMRLSGRFLVSLRESILQAPIQDCVKEVQACSHEENGGVPSRARMARRLTVGTPCAELWNADLLSPHMRVLMHPMENQPYPGAFFSVQFTSCHQLHNINQIVIESESGHCEDVPDRKSCRSIPVRPVSVLSAPELPHKEVEPGVRSYHAISCVHGALRAFVFHSRATAAAQAKWHCIFHRELAKGLAAPEVPAATIFLPLRIMLLVHTWVPNSPKRQFASVFVAAEHSTSGCQTPSTEAVSEDGADAAPDSSCFGTPPPTPGQVMAGTLKKSLGGAWVGAEGESYIILCDNLFLTCVRTDNRHWGSGLQGVVSEPGQKNSRAWSKELFFDFRDNMIWWGRERSYFLDVSEIRWTPEEVTWHVSGNGEGPRQPFTWHRPHENWADAAESTQMKPSVFGSVSPVKVKRWNKQPRVASPSEPREASPETVATKQQASKELPAAPAISAAAAPRSQSRWEDHTWCSAKDWCSAKEQRHGRQSEGDSLAARVLTHLLASDVAWWHVSVTLFFFES